MLRGSFLALASLLALAGATVAEAADPTIRIDADGRLGVDLEDAPLDRVLGALAAALAVEVVIDGTLEATVTTRFEGIAPARAVRRLVGPLPLVMRWTPAGELRSIRVRGAPPLVALTMSGTTAPARPPAMLEAAGVPPPDPPLELDEASAARLERRLAQRVRRLQADFRPPPGVPDPLELAGALAEDDPAARRAAIRRLAALGDGSAAVHLGEALESETDPALRRLTLAALAGIDHPLARELVAAALD